MKLIIAHLTNGGINGGSVKYLDELVPLLLREPGVERLRVFVPSAYRIPEESSECFQSIPKWDHLSGYPSIQAAVKRDSFDAAFSSNTRWVEFRGLPTMVMVRNMEPLLPASRLTPILARVKNILRLWETRRAVLNSDRVVGVSKFVCEHLINRWRINPEKVALVYHGVGAGLQSNGIPPAMLRDLKQPFALSAGSIQPYRG